MVVQVVRIMDGKFHDSDTSGDLIRINKHLSQRNDTPNIENININSNGKRRNRARNCEMDKESEKYNNAWNLDMSGVIAISGLDYEKLTRMTKMPIGKRNWDDSLFACDGTLIKNENVNENEDEHEHDVVTH